MLGIRQSPPELPEVLMVLLVMTWLWGMCHAPLTFDLLAGGIFLLWNEPEDPDGVA